MREKTFTLTSIAGPSGSGKTYSALLYARGLVGPDGKIGFIDTENKRSRFYADVAGGFDVIDLDPPFTSSRYIEAIKEFEKAGYPAIIIDSISHEWEGTGGVLEQAEAIEQATKRAGLHCWAKPKGGHKKLMNELLQTRAHLIFCCRVKEKVVQAKGANGKTEIVNEGFVAVQEKSFIYEMTISMMLAEGTHIPTILKCPGDMLHAFPDGKRVTPQVGEVVRTWSDIGKEIDEAFEAAKREGMKAANDGVRALSEWWSALDKPGKARLERIKDTLKSVAQAADQMKSDLMDVGAGDPGQRLAHAKSISETTERGEGFDPDHVRNQIASLTSASTGDDQPTATDLPATAEDGDNPGEVTSSAAPSSATLSDDDRKSLAYLIKRLNASVGPDPQVVIATAQGVKAEGRPLSELAAAKAKTIVKQFISACEGTMERGDAVEYACGIAGIDVKDVEGAE
ncbi:AAA family ATPase [Phyllobacterium phragmitis]|uniref:AAA family ATPase n=1 Tax=Phyllobacterium phragmitis TaxID=2670329 RepID=UPI001FE18472|nr:AAA family ATPase [Phyllobacterium phragmitis]